MNTLPRRSRRRLFVPTAEHIDKWETKRQNDLTGYRQAVEHDQPGTHRIRPSIKDLAVLATLGVMPTSVIIALTAAPVDLLLAGGSLLSGSAGTWLLAKRATRSATEGRQNTPANHNDCTQLTAGARP